MTLLRMNRSARRPLALPILALTLALPATSFAQASPAPAALPPGHPPVGAQQPGPIDPGAQLPPGHPMLAPAQTGASVNTAMPPGHPPIAPSAAGEPVANGIPAGHPPLGTAPRDPHDGHATASDIQQMELPETGTAEARDLPAGVILVRVVDPSGNPVPNAPVRLGAMRDGEQQHAREATTRGDGIAQFDHLETGGTIAYRASTDNDGARFGATPFQLPSNAGYHVQLVRFPVVHDPRTVLVTEARVEVQFAEDRLIVAEHISLVNFSNMSLGGQPPRPVAFVPTNGLRFGLPSGATAFRDDPTMGDQHITEEGGAAVLRGSIPPTGASEHIDLAFQYRVRYEGNSADIDVSLPLPVLRAIVGTQAAPGMQLSVEGMGGAEERTFNGQRILVTGRERTSREDPGLDHLHIRIANIPSSAGPERTAATVAALAIAFGSVAFGVRSKRERRDSSKRARPIESLEAERDRLLETARGLAREYAAGDLGPETFARRQREVSIALAGVFKSIAETKAAAQAPASKARGKGAKRA